MSHWKEAGKLKRQQQAESIPPDWRLNEIPTEFKSALPIVEGCGILTPSELIITNTDAPILLAELKSGKLTSVAVVTAFCKRAAVLQQLTRCCTEMFFPRALEQARSIDEHFAKTGELAGPLHGLPVSLKDGFDVKDCDTSVGWCGLCFKPAVADATQTMAATTRLGAVPYVKTNVPQSLMMSDSYNHVFKQSVNSLNRNLVSGGSSGGEGALVGARGSIFGIGTDIGGSIRIPAALQGIYGLCPSTGRISFRDSARHQKHLIPSVAGPLTSTIGALKTYMEAYCSTKPWELDPTLVPLPWQKRSCMASQRKLKIGFIHDDGIILPQPPVQRAMHVVRDLFVKGGHDCVDWDSSTHYSAYYDIWLPGILADGGVRCARLCEMTKEPLIEGMLVGQPKDFMDSDQRQAHAEKILDYKEMYLKKMVESKVDAIIMPVIPWVGFKPKQWVESKQCCGYTAHWNLVDYTALATPTGVFVNKDLDKPENCPNWSDHEYRSESDEYNHGQYDLDLVDGMPVNVQIITGKFGEEKAVMVAEVLEELRKNYRD